MYLPDENQPGSLPKRFAQCYTGNVVISAITDVELEYGVSVSANSARERRNLAGLIKDIPMAPFDVNVARVVAALLDQMRDLIDDEPASFSYALWQKPCAGRNRLQIPGDSSRSASIKTQDSARADCPIPEVAVTLPPVPRQGCVVRHGEYSSRLGPRFAWQTQLAIPHEPSFHFP